MLYSSCWSAEWIRIALAVQYEQADLRALMRRYRNKPMWLADACLVRLSEIHAAGTVLTLDSDFRVSGVMGIK